MIQERLITSTKLNENEGLLVMVWAQPPFPSPSSLPHIRFWNPQHWHLCKIKFIFEKDIDDTWQKIYIYFGENRKVEVVVADFVK